MIYKNFFHKEKIVRLVWVFALILFSQYTTAQSFFAGGFIGQGEPFYKIQINSGSSCSSSCSEELIGSMGIVSGGLTMSPEGDLYKINGPNIFLVDTLTGVQQFIYGWPPGEVGPMSGLVSTGSGIFYSITDSWPGHPGDSLLRLDTNTGTITNLGNVGWQLNGDITMFNGEFYFIGTITNPPLHLGIIKLDINNPTNNELIVSFSIGWDVVGLTASSICNTLLATGHSSDLPVYINLIDGATISVCDIHLEEITSMREFGSPTICSVEIDLDCDDSSGATVADFNSNEFDCLSNPVLIADNDIGMLYDAIISEMTIQITGFIPDAPFEILNLNRS